MVTDTEKNRVTSASAPSIPDLISDAFCFSFSACIETSIIRIASRRFESSKILNTKIRR